ncbi:type II toxin-antitoxin system VapC family toxin [Aurantibacillus circumpalustris]|uniref:type II toxin-antitoxin system VapC family toxin n=1 Tax=Aurantibacillus circumpalustris TaxID=3036359 RepID=UPI00295A574B|nr:PIN domain-containing protein [Aurantibacillus circumpalustris]
MKVFLDANVLISVLNKEYPVFTYSSRVLSLTESTRFKLYTSPICLAIAFYFSEKKSGTLVARQKLNILSQKLNFTAVGPKSVESVVKNKKIHDLEDGLQYYSAIDSGCVCIVTEDQSDFYFSEIEVLTSRAFLENYIF